MAGLLRTILSDVLQEGEMAQIASGIDIVGDIAIIKIPEPLLAKRFAIGERLLHNLRSVRTVLRQVAGVSGEFRLRTLEKLAGEDKMSTVYRESGCEFEVDLSSAYFSPRLAFERLRIAGLVRDGETVVNLFGGVATFAVVIAKRRPDAKVFTVDVNPKAHEFAIRNLARNKIMDRVVALLGDAREIVERQLHGVADRVLMQLPEKAEEFIDVALGSLKPDGGVIHYYTFVRAPKHSDPVREAIREVHELLQVNHKVQGAKVVREVGPRFTEVVVDIEVPAGS